jgi:dipeptidyl-peptidase-4
MYTSIVRSLWIILAIVLTGPLLSQDQLPALNPEKGIRFHPVIQHIEGWKIHIQPVLLRTDDGKQSIRMLADHLHRISILIPEEPLKKMRTLEIWIEEDHPTLKSMQYHPSLGWLENNGHDPRLAKKVHIPVAAHLLSRQQLLKHPAVVLHELAHAYHDQILDFDHPEILEAYKKAEAAGRYEEVLLYPGKKVRHYGLTNHKEYFAEATEAYFYRNDFYPFVRAELELHDPAIHRVLEKIWGDAR